MKKFKADALLDRSVATWTAASVSDVPSKADRTEMRKQVSFACTDSERQSKPMVRRARTVAAPSSGWQMADPRRVNTSQCSGPPAFLARNHPAGGMTHPGLGGLPSALLLAHYMDGTLFETDVIVRFKITGWPERVRSRIVKCVAASRRMTTKKISNLCFSGS